MAVSAIVVPIDVPPEVGHVPIVARPVDEFMDLRKMDPQNDSPLFCNRCLIQLTAGRGQFYSVTIEAVADPSPPAFEVEDLQRNIRGEINKLVKQLSKCSERELMDQVHRRVTIQLCNTCYRDWIEDPT